MTFNSLSSVGSNKILNINKERAEVIISFTTKNFVPSSGTLEIVFPNTVTKVYANCRSATSTSIGSLLKSASGNSG